MAQPNLTEEDLLTERFIHQGLLVEAEAMVKHLYAVWKKDKKVPRLAFSWPAEEIKADDGSLIDRMVSLEVPEEPVVRVQALRTLAIRTKAYGLFVIEPEAEQIRVVFETPHGTRSWTISIQVRGDRKALGRPVVRDNTDTIGLLWSRHREMS